MGRPLPSLDPPRLAAEVFWFFETVFLVAMFKPLSPLISDYFHERLASLDRRPSLRKRVTATLLQLAANWAEMKKGSAFANPLNSLAPRPGLEPGTCGLTESQARVKLFIISLLQPKNQFV